MVSPAIRRWIPPRAIALVDYLSRGRSGLAQLVPSWDDARAGSNSYDTEFILQRVRDATERTRQSGNTSSVERDGSILVDAEPPMPLVACLLRSTRVDADAITVIDFGGALGTTYRQCAKLLSVVRGLRWHVVEQPGFVKCGRAEYQTSTIQFFDTIDEAVLASRPDVFLFSSVLQYLDDPYQVLARAIELKPRAIIIDRTPVSDLVLDTYTIQYVPSESGSIRLPFRIFGKDKLVQQLRPGYDKIVEFAALDPDMLAGLITRSVSGISV